MTSRGTSLAAWMGLGLAPRPLRHPRKPRPEPTPEEVHRRDLDRAWRCGVRYSTNRWKRRASPRMRCDRPGAPEAAVLREPFQSFYRGYDATTWARYARARPQPSL